MRVLKLLSRAQQLDGGFTKLFVSAPTRNLSGLGNCPPPSNADNNAQIAGVASSAAISIGATALVAGGVLTAASGGLLAPIAPVVGLLISNLFTPDYCKIDTSNAANIAENSLVSNMTAWKSLSPAEKCKQQAQYVANYHQIMNTLYTFCGQPIFGTAGQNCISERSPGGKWDPTAGWLNPILNDPDIQNCPAPVVQSVDNAAASVSSFLNIPAQYQPYIVPIGLALLLAIIL